MKIITLIRHAEASVAEAGQPDIERSLSQYGEQMAPVMGRRLAKHNIIPDVVYSSSANRALQTAHIICYEVSFPVENIQVKPDIYHAKTTGQILQLLDGAEEDCEHLFLFGHNPYLTELANVLCSQSRISHMATCGVFRVQFDVEFWAEILPGKGVFLEYDTPENL